MIFAFLSILLVNIILYYHYRWAHYCLFTYIPHFCLGIAIIAAMLFSLTLVLNAENKTLSYKNTISEKIYQLIIIYNILIMHSQFEGAFLFIKKVANYNIFYTMCVIISIERKKRGIENANN